MWDLWGYSDPFGSADGASLRGATGTLKSRGAHPSSLRLDGGRPWTEGEAGSGAETGGDEPPPSPSRRTVSPPRIIIVQEGLVPAGLGGGGRTSALRVPWELLRV